MENPLFITGGFLFLRWYSKRHMNEYTEEVTQQNNDAAAWYQGSFFILLGLLFLLPLVFFPSVLAPFQFTKTALAIILTAGAFILFIAASLKRGGVSFAWSPLILSLYILLLGYGIGTLLSSDSTLSFAGYQFETDTFVFIAAGVIVAHLAASVMRPTARLFTALATFAVATWLVFVFQVAQVLFGFSLPGFEYGITLLGRWYDLAMFAGLVGGVSLLTLEFLPLPRVLSAVFILTYGVSLFIMALSRVQEVWLLFGITSLAVLVFALFRQYFSKSHTERSPSMVVAIIGFVAACYFFFFGAGVSTALQQAAGLNLFDVRPAFSSTVDVLRSVYATNALVGSGPNTFGVDWLLYRSAEIAQTPFWNVSFTVGSGTIISSVAVGGLVMLFVWAFFILMLGYTAVRALFEVTFAERRASVLTILAAFGAVYLAVLHIIVAPSQSLTVLMFVFVGLFAASLHGTSLTKEVTLVFKKSPRLGFVFVLVGLASIAGTLGSIFNVGVTYAAALSHNQAILTANSGDLAAATTEIARAIALDPEDRYYRTATLINMAEINQLIASGKNDTDTQTQFQNALARAVEYSGLAIAERSSYENLLTRALVYASVVPLGIEGAFENAETVFAEAKKKNPYDPEPDFNLARMHAIRGELDEAREAITASLAKKADYTNAILLRAQIELDEGNLDEAINAVKNAIYFEPNNSILLYQLGIMLLQDRSYEEAAAAFELALQIESDFANAQFFLSQAYASLGRLDDAEVLMAKLLEENPDNLTVREYRAAFARGENPFVEVPVAPEADTEAVVE